MLCFRYLPLRNVSKAAIVSTGRICGPEPTKNKEKVCNKGRNDSATIAASKGPGSSWDKEMHARQERKIIDTKLLLLLLLLCNNENNT